MDCRVAVEAAVPVYDVATTDEAVRIAISKTGDMLNPDLNYVEINMGERTCPHCDEPVDPAFVAADESLVALELEMTVFNVEREEHASRIARKEIGSRLEKIPLEVLEVDVIEEETESETDGDATPDTPDESEPSDTPMEGSSVDESSSDAEPESESRSDSEDDELPDFEDVIADKDR